MGGILRADAGRLAGIGGHSIGYGRGAAAHPGDRAGSHAGGRPADLPGADDPAACNFTLPPAAPHRIRAASAGCAKAAQRRKDSGRTACAWNAGSGCHSPAEYPHPPAPQQTEAEYPHPPAPQQQQTARPNARGLAMWQDVELASLTEKNQKTVLEAMESTLGTPNLSQAIRIKKLQEDGRFSQEKIEEFLSEIKQKDVDRVVFKNEQLYRYFPSYYTAEQMKREILTLLKINMTFE